MFLNKKLLITGGTGSFGKAVVERFIDSELQEIRVFSRDEKKQDDLRKRFLNSKLQFYIGDVRDPQSVRNAMAGVDFVFHAAALKQVPSCEFHPLEAVKTNIIGTENVLDAAIRERVSRVVCLSTDKAVQPVNAMGMTKALMEKIAVSKARTSTGRTVICSTRYGNVVGSRGSVIPLFRSQIKENLPLTLTDPEMTRFMMTLDQAVELVLFAFENGVNGDLFIQKAPAATVEEIANAVIKLSGAPTSYPKAIIGTRHGEKLYETLLAKEELMHAIDLGDYFRVPADLRDLNYNKFVESGQKDIEQLNDYTSHNTSKLNKIELVDMMRHALMSSGEF